ncbi:hypothetical protein GDO81_008682 [Engystomops pustulosus]|uniref:Taste receptor type 2 n=1 Tax=Engystomops pustulosus TaxID=76066 RepID=A0AAV7CGJ5_ENGPU|nr:hypothetical protein GDO81_008682 [Engystomops pustulosus]KAG8584095.1 hypothetical protein GDO81_008682 [Engystomops pustulosus]
MYEHNIFKIILIFLTLAVYIVMVAFNAGAGSGLMKDVFLQRVGNLSDKFNTNITPAGWTFMIWNVIFAWQFLWLGYVLAGICRRSELGWMYLKPDVFPIPFYIVWILNNILNIGWLFLWDREFLIPALVFLGAIALTNHIVLFISYRALYLHGEWFDKQRRVDLWLIRIFVQNGIAVYATWTTIASLLNFAVALTYNGNIPNGTSTTVCLSLLAFEVLLWFILENFLFDKYVRYTLTVYPVVFVALSGVLDKHFNEAAPDGNNIYIAVLLAVACALFVVRVLLVIWRHFKQPFYSRSTSKTSFPLA